MKNYMHILFAVLFWSCAATAPATPSESPLQEVEKKQRPKKVTAFDKFKESFFPDRIDAYIDAKDNGPCKVTTDDGTITSYRYNGQHQKIETRVIDNAGIQMQRLQHVTSHSPQSHAVVITTRNESNIVILRHTLKYDTQHRTTESVIENFEDNYTGTMKYKYDAEGYLIEESLESAGEVEITTFSYDDSTNTIEISIELPNGNKLTRQVVRYDEKLTKSITESTNFVEGLWKTKKDVVQLNDGQVTHVKVWKDGTLTSTMQFRYKTDAKGRVIQMDTIHTLGSGDPFTTTNKLFYHCP